MLQLQANESHSEEADEDDMQLARHQTRHLLGMKTQKSVSAGHGEIQEGAGKMKTTTI